MNIMNKKSIVTLIAFTLMIAGIAPAYADTTNLVDSITSVVDPFFVAVDYNDRIIVLDKSTKDILIFNSTGNLVDSFQTNMATPYSIAVDHDNRILVTDLTYKNIKTPISNWSLYTQSQKSQSRIS